MRWRLFALVLLIVSVLSMMAMTLFAQANPNYKSVKIINSDSTHGTIDGTIYRDADGLLRFMWGGLAYKFIPTYHGTSPTTVTVGGLSAGTNIKGNTIQDIIESIVSPYVNPVFTSFSVTGQATTIEVGTTLSGSKTFTWAITVNSGVVPTISIFDVNASANILTNTANDGSQSATVNTIQLNTNGATQAWRGIGNNTSPVGTFNSSDFTVTARFLRFYGPTASSPSNSAQVRALPTSEFHTGASTFNLLTGTTQTKFVVALPPSVTISQVIDLDALNANITAQYVLTGTVNVLDAGGTNRAYNIYEMNIGAPYSTSHRHAITTAN